MNKLKLKRIVVLANTAINPASMAELEMKKLFIKLNSPATLVGDQPREDCDVICYEVLTVVGSVSPYVGEYLSSWRVKDLCDQTGTWVVTFV